MKRMVAASALAFMLAVAVAPMAFAAEPVQFRVGGVTFNFTLPPGFCAPKDKFIDVAQLVAASDNLNVTDLTAYRCEGGVLTADAPLLIKTPKSVLIADVDRPELLKQMGAVFDNPAMASALASGKIDSENSKSISEVLGESVAVKSQIKPLGKDETCAYLAGTIAIQSAGEGEPAASAVAACITAVKKRILLIYAFGPYSGPESIIALAPRAKALALQLISENP